MELTLTNKEAQFLSDLLHRVRGPTDSRAVLVGYLIDKLGREDSTTADMDGFIKLQPIKDVRPGQIWETDINGLTVCIQKGPSQGRLGPGYHSCIVVKICGGHEVGDCVDIASSSLKRLITL
jgi:hypothetical protein